MNRSEFIKVLEDPKNVRNEQLKDLEQLSSNFPYFQLPLPLIASAHNESESSLAIEKIKKASIFSNDRKALWKLLNNNPASAFDQAPTIEKAKAKTKPTPSTPKNKPLPQKEVAETEIESTETLPKTEVQKETKKEPPIQVTKKDEPVHIERLVIPDVLKKELEKDSKTEKTPKTRTQPPLEEEVTDQDKNSINEGGSSDAHTNEMVTETTVNHDQKPKIGSELTDLPKDLSNTVETEESAKKEEEGEDEATGITPLSFKQTSSEDYFNERSNINFDNLIPEAPKDYHLDESNINKSLIPGELDIEFGIGESRLGEVLLSSIVLKEEGKEDLILKPQENKLNRQIEIIDSFLDKLPSIKLNKDQIPLNQNENLAKRKLVIGEDVTETLAEIYLNQGNRKKAKNIYKKLMLKYPEKKAYFAKKLRDNKLEE